MTADDTPAGFMVEQRQPHTDSVMGESSTTEPPLVGFGSGHTGAALAPPAECVLAPLAPAWKLLWHSAIGGQCKRRGVDRAPGTGRRRSCHSLSQR